MNIIKTSEKILIWMHRTGITYQNIATECGITRQAVSQMIKDNVISLKVIIACRRKGFKE